MDYFVLFAYLFNLTICLYSLFIMLRFFYRVFKYKAKIVSDLGAIILISFIWAFFIMAMVNGEVVVGNLIFLLTEIFSRRVFAYNSEVFVFSGKVCNINQIKIESEKIMFISRVTVKTNQNTDKAKTKIILSLNKNNHIRFKRLLQRSC